MGLVLVLVQPPWYVHHNKGQTDTKACISIFSGIHVCTYDGRSSHTSACACEYKAHIPTPSLLVHIDCTLCLVIYSAYTFTQIYMHLPRENEVLVGVMYSHERSVTSLILMKTETTICCRLRAWALHATHQQFDNAAQPYKKVGGADANGST